MNRVLVAAVLGLCGSASAVDVLVLSSGYQAMDDLLVTALSLRGHNVTIGPQYFQFDGSLNLAPFDAVYLQPNYNWTGGDMPAPGQNALQTWIAGGGGLVTCEWTIWKAVATGSFATLAPLFPSESNGAFTSRTSAVLTRGQSDPIFSAGLAQQFTLPLTSIAGTETNLQARPGAVVFWATDAFPNAGAALGGTHGGGRVVNLWAVMGFDSVADGNGATLLSNAVNWAADAQACYADCDTFTGARVLDIFDFLCFQTLFASNDPYACDCDLGTGVGVCDIFDFLCFQNAFAGGCP